MNNYLWLKPCLIEFIGNLLAPFFLLKRRGFKPLGINYQLSIGSSLSTKNVTRKLQKLSLS